MSYFSNKDKDEAYAEWARERLWHWYESECFERESMPNKKIFNTEYAAAIKTAAAETVNKSIWDNLSLRMKEAAPETKSIAMNKEDLAREVVDLLGPNEMVFGTYVRDQIARKTAYREMNVFLNSVSGRESEARNKFIARLHERFGSYSTVLGSVATVTDNGVSCQKQRVKLQPQGASGPWIEFDLVTNLYNDAFVHASSDVEAVGIQNGQLVVGAGYTLDKIKESIANKVFTPRANSQFITKNNKLYEDGFVSKEEKLAGEKAKIDSKKVIGEAEIKPSATAINDIKKAMQVVQLEQAGLKDLLKIEETEGKRPMNMITIKAEAQEAAYRVAAAQMVKGVKTALVKGLQDKKTKKSQIQAVRDLLDSELGTVMISESLGYALKYMPGIKDDPRAQKLSEEFRIAGMATAGNMVMNELLGVLLPVLTESLKALPSLPEVPKVESPKEEKAATPAQIEEVIVQQVAVTSTG